MSSSAEHRGAGMTLRGGLLGAAACLGWVLHDAGMFLRTGVTEPFLDLVPASLVGVAAGALVGAVLSVRRAVAGAWCVLVLGAWLVSRRVELPVAGATLRLPLVAGLLTAVYLAAGRRERLGRAAREAVCLGVLAAALVSWRHLDSWGVSGTAAAAATAALLLGFVSRRGLRVGGTLAAALAALGWLGLQIVARDRLPRPDLPPTEATAAAGRPSLLLVVLDTVRADRFGVHGYGRATTPGLDAFAREHATVWTDARSASSWTLPSHASLLTGLTTAEHGATHPRGAADAGTVRNAQRPAQPLRADVTTLAEELRASGYQTGAIVANGAYLDHRYGLDRGFERYDDRPNAWVGVKYVALGQLLGAHPEAGHRVYRDGRTITDEALAWLDERRPGAPFFLFLNYMDAHEPRMPPPSLDREFEDRRPLDRMAPEPELRSLIYDRSLCYLDSQVTRLLEQLDARGLFDETAVVVTSDHGEALGEHDFVGHAWTLYDEVVHVPLFVKPAGGRGAGRDDRAIGPRGVHALLLELARAPRDERPGAAWSPDWPPAAPRATEPTAWLGEWYHGEPNPEIERWAARSGRDLAADLVSWREGGRKLIVGSDGTVRAFDLDADPGERTPLELSDLERAGALARARAWWAGHPPRAPVVQETDPEHARRLDALGY